MERMAHVAFPDAEPAMRYFDTGHVTRASWYCSQRAIMKHWALTARMRVFQT
eukprot:CAMPEP_0183370728 /NCGR_PEP_ID=MMETSP0164_2-20130417/103290_1 /TAXON_ID=221442 /ORGANISM="Coccolithus pelagicus ssp braarudi, Strain PLY182g" /LENGTH=51 /DNA_ID=CAMNT_0025547177 /DNA_START=49 /DNA_END=200 /DNA_ORIENTATION=+